MNFSVTIADDLCKKSALDMGWTETVKDAQQKDIPNPKTFQEFVNEQVVFHIGSCSVTL